MRLRAERVIVGVALAVLVFGASVIALTTPGYTRVLMLRTDGPNRTGLSDQLAIQTAEDVRRYVAGRAPEPLPATVGGREAFDERAVAHLDDVRAVFNAARIATSFAAAILAAWLAWCLASRRSGALEAGLLAGAITTFGFVVLAAVVGVLDFDRFFSGFHGIFFDSDSWIFADGDLIIQLFPEPFWTVSAALVGVLAALGGGFLVAASRLVRRSFVASALLDE